MVAKKGNKPINPAPQRKRRTMRTKLVQLLISLAIVVVINIIGSYIFHRFDLTSEKRYTLSDATRKFIKEVDDVVFFKVYLEGDFPAGFKRLRMETKEMLDEFRAYNDNIQYKFINPSEGSDKKAVKAFYEQLMSKGLEPTSLQVKTNDGNSQQLIFPGAIVSYRDKELPLQLLMNQQGTDPEMVLNNSVQGLEYNLANVIRKLITTVKPKIAFVNGQGELEDIRVADVAYSLSEYYSVDKVIIDQKLSSLARHDSIRKVWVNKYEAIIIAKPDSVFNEKDKYMIDQFVMRGGKILWLIDPVVASMDSLQTHNETIGFGRDLNLEDMLFKYGVRLNADLLIDMNALPIPVVTGDYGGQPQQQFYTWYYFPVLMPYSKHPIVNNLNAIKCEFASSIDTVGPKNIRKTILLTTSKYSRPISTPARISLDIIQDQPDSRLFNKPYQTVAVLLEGSFNSIFIGRLPPEITNDKENFDFRETSPETRMIVISDGDIIKNQLDLKQGYPMPLGFDQYTNQTFGNKDFILNCVDYLCDESGLMAVRCRELKLRLLDKNKIAVSGMNYKIFNTIAPVLFIIIYGLIQAFVRRRKYTNSRVRR